MHNPQFLLISHFKDVESHIHICIVCCHLKFFLHLVDHVIFMCGALLTAYQPIINKDGNNQFQMSLVDINTRICKAWL